MRLSKREIKEVDDYYNNLIKVGTIVAFNYCGMVRLGFVTKIYEYVDDRCHHSSMDYKTYKIHVSHKDQPNLISVMKNTSNLISLETI